MGSYHLLFAAPLLLASPALAQDAQQAPPVFTLPPANSGNATPGNPAQQGPELDVFRPSTTPATPPPVVTPTVVPPPVPVQPTARPTMQPRPQSQPTPAPAPAQQPQPRRETPTPAKPAPAEPAPLASDSVRDNEPVNETAPIVTSPEPAPAANNAETAPAPTAVAAADESSALPWIIGGLALLIALAGAAFALRRREAAPAKPIIPAAEPLPTPVEPTPVAPIEEATSIAPPLAPAPAAPTEESEAIAVDADRPWLNMDLAIGQARYSLMGVTIAYTLLLHNRGTQDAQDILVRGVVGNAGPAQQALLEAFFTGQIGFPLHSAVSIAPGDMLRLSGELRLGRDEILPVEMGQRSLLIPIAAFDTSYRWGAEDEATDPQGSGRTARAFIVGQEQEPPADRLAPFRLDQGPRQYRRPAARAAAELPAT